MSLPFLSQADNGSAAPGTQYLPGNFSRAIAFSAERIFEDSAPLLSFGGSTQVAVIDSAARDNGSLDSREASFTDARNYESSLDTQSCGTKFPDVQRTVAETDAELELAEGGLAHREESEILTQAAVDALPRTASGSRRPSVVQFRDQPSSNKAAPTSAKSRFQVAGKMAMAASHFQLYNSSKPTAGSSRFQHAVSDASANSSSFPAGLSPSITWRLKIRAALAARVASRKSLLGEGATMKGHSLGLFSIVNPYRLAVFKILYSQAFEYLLFCAIIIHIVAITSESGKRNHSSAVYGLDIGVLCFYLLEMAAKIFALGLWKGKTAFLRNSYNCLDLLIVVSSWALKITAWNNVYQPIYPGVLRAFRAVLCLRSFSAVGAIIATLECTGQALPQLGDVFLFTGMAALLFGLAGVQLFSGSFRRGCALSTGPGPNDWVTANPSWPCGTITSPGETVREGAKGYQCPAEQGQFCTAAVGAPNYGNTGFDNLGQAALLMIQTLSFESWEYNMWDTIDAEHQYASIYYILFILLGPFVLINVFVAAISSVFLQLRRKNQILLEMDTKRKEKRRERAHALRTGSIQSEKQPSRKSSGVSGFIQSYLPLLTAAPSGSKQFGFWTLRSSKVAPGSNSFSETSLQRLVSESSYGSSEGRAVDESICRSSCAKCQALAKRIVSSQLFHYGTGLLVLGNFIVMCLYRPGDQSSRAKALHIVELSLAGVFMGEALLRVIAAGTWEYFSNPGELFDFAIIAASLVGLSTGKFPNLNMARIFRYIRALGRNRRGRETVIFRLAGAWRPMLGLFAFLFLVITVVAVVAMQLFGGQYGGFPDGMPRGNFDHFPVAWLTIFQVTSSDEWLSITWEAMRVHWSAALFFGLCWLFTNIVVLNLVIALVLAQFRLKDAAKLAAQRKEVLKAIHAAQVSRNALVTAIESVRVRCILLWRAEKWSKDSAAKHSPYFAHIAAGERLAAKLQAEAELQEGHAPPKFRRSSGLKQNISTSNSFATSRSGSSVPHELIHAQLRQSFIASENGSQGVGANPLVGDCAKVHDSAETVFKRPPVASLVMKQEFGKQTHYRRGSLVVLAALKDLDENSKARTSRLPPYMRDKSLGVFPTTSRARQLAVLVSESFWYRWVSMGVIAISVLAVIWTPNSSEIGPDTRRHTVKAMNYATAIFFAFDAIMKMVAKGVLFTPNAYFQDTWAWMDFFLLLVDLLRLRTYSGYKERVLRAMTALRGVRVMIRQPSIRELMTALIKTMGPVATLFLLAFSLFVIFALLAIRLFGNKLYSCNDSSITTGREDCFGLFISPLSGVLMPRVWQRPDYNFDSLGKAVLTLFELGTLDNWGDTLFAAMDITGVDRQPRRNAQWQNAIFFIVFVCVSAHFMIKAFVGVFCEQFETITGIALLTDKQKTWRNLTRTALRLKPIRFKRAPKTPFKAWCFAVTENQWFPLVATVVILVNMGFLASYSYGQSVSWSHVLNAVDCGFTAIYVLEVYLRWQAAGNLWRWVSVWNVFEAILALGSIATVFPAPGSMRASVSRPFGFVRILRILRFSPGMARVGGTLLLAGRAMLTILSSVGIVAFAYAGVGVQLFASVKFGLNMNRQVNFQSFSNSFLFLFQVLTGENWRYTMDDVKVHAPYCTANPPPGRVTDCGSSVGGTMFFVSFVILNSYLLSNLFVAAILEHVTSGLLNKGAQVTPRDLDLFQKVWAVFDPHRTGHVGLHRFRKFLVALRRARCALGAKAGQSGWERPVRYEAWHAHVAHRGLPFADALLLLLHDKLGRHALTYDVRKQRDEDRKEFMQGGAAAIIQAHVRGYLTRKRIARIKARRADPNYQKQRRQRAPSPNRQRKAGGEGSTRHHASSKGSKKPHSEGVRPEQQHPSIASFPQPAVEGLNAQAVLLNLRQQAPAWPERKEEPLVQEQQTSFEINGRPVFGSLETSDGLAPSGLLTGQPRRTNSRLAIPRTQQSPRTDITGLGRDLTPEARPRAVHEGEGGATAILATARLLSGPPPLQIPALWSMPSDALAFGRSADVDASLLNLVIAGRSARGSQRPSRANSVSLQSQ